MDRRRGPRPPEVRAKIAATLRSRLEGEQGQQERERLCAILEDARKLPRKPRRPRQRTEADNYFDKLRRIVGSAAARAQMARGVNG